MNIKTEIARLERVNEEYFVWIAEWMYQARKMVVELGDLVGKILRDGGSGVVVLPRGIKFQYTSSGNWKIWKEGEFDLGVQNGQVVMDDKFLPIFIEYVAEGWVRELADFLQEEAERHQRISDAVGKMVTASEEEIRGIARGEFPICD